MTPSSLLLVGCGKMGGAMLSRWQQKHPAGIHRFRIIEPAQSHQNTDHVSWFHSLDEVPAAYEPSVIVFAVKPQQLPAMLPAFRERFIAKNPLYISIAAGKTLRFFQMQLGERASVVRAMPNSPALVGEGITALCALPFVSAPQRELATQLMDAVGQSVWIEDETQMDAVTAISGSGPAYVFLFLESLMKAGVEAGLSEEASRKLALATLAGSCALASQSTDSFEILRKNVTSPGGTTEAALSLLMREDGLEKLVKEAVLKAVSRSKEL